MSVINYAVSGRDLNASVRVFRNLVLLWVMFLVATFFIIAAFSSKAHAVEPLPLPKVTREIASPDISSFSVPPKGLVADRCQSLLTSARLEIDDDRSEEAANPSRRTAGNLQMVKTIKAYRQCRSQSALQELAAWRWSR